MTDPVHIAFAETSFEDAKAASGRIAVTLGADGALSADARRISRLAKGSLGRFARSERAGKMKPGEVAEIAWPAGIEAEAILVARLDRNAAPEHARRAGAAIARKRGKGDLRVFAGNLRAVADLAQGIALGSYAYLDQKTGEAAERKGGAVTVMCSAPAEAETAYAPMAAVAEGVFMTRDLVNMPANVLTTTHFAERLENFAGTGLEVEVLDEDALERLGMRTLLAVGMGSESPSKVVVMQWKGGGDEPPLALVGKGVVFDTGGISIKPAAGMEDMTMDMGGAGTVAGVMFALARRKARANVVGLVGLVENMPDGRAQRPGDVVVTMKGDTVEVINTDAEGRLVLCDVMWYAQERFEPDAMIDLATLTGAIIVGLGHENAGVFSNDDALAEAFLKAAREAGEGAWRMPLGDAYDRMLKSRIADLKNVGGRAAGSITAAQFLLRFVKDGTPWIHLDIAGTASRKEATDLGPAGATGWGVRALDRLVQSRER